MGEFIPMLTQFGAAGLIGALWIIERRHAMARDRQIDEAHRVLVARREEAESLLTVVKENTRAVASLEASQRELVRLLTALSPGASEPRDVAWRREGKSGEARGERG